MIERIQDLLTNVVPLIIALGWVLAIYAVLLWAASVLWAYRDIRSRSDDVVVQVLAISMVFLLPFAGIILHLILRPRQTLGQKYERELEEQYLRRDLEEQYACPSCQRGIEPDFIVCPYCHTSLRRRCQSCDRVVDLTWSVCPYCGDGSAAKPTRTYQNQIAVDPTPVELLER